PARQAPRSPSRPRSSPSSSSAPTSPLPGIKKGREGPCLRIATVAHDLAIRGDAPFYDYQRLVNKIAHRRALSSFPCEASSTHMLGGQANYGLPFECPRFYIGRLV